jgi:hypothetical protein
VANAAPLATWNLQLADRINPVRVRILPLRQIVFNSLRRFGDESEPTPRNDARVRAANRQDDQFARIGRAHQHRNCADDAQTALVAANSALVAQQLELKAYPVYATFLSATCQDWAVSRANSA